MLSPLPHQCRQAEQSVSLFTSVIKQIKDEPVEGIASVVLLIGGFAVAVVCIAILGAMGG